MNTPAPLDARSAVAALALAVAVPFGLWAVSEPLLAGGVLLAALAAGLAVRTAAARFRRPGGWRGRMHLPVVDLSLEVGVTHRTR